jgi:hypothetical protein
LPGAHLTPVRQQILKGDPAVGPDHPVWKSARVDFLDQLRPSDWWQGHFLLDPLQDGHDVVYRLERHIE